MKRGLLLAQFTYCRLFPSREAENRLIIRIITLAATIFFSKVSGKIVQGPKCGYKVLQIVVVFQSSGFIP
jgi:hypothetical protein